MNPLNPFAVAVWVRNKLYDRGAFKVHKLSKPVVSVGNISVGGTGKTPFVITLGRLLKERGIEFDVLSRGYGRKSKEVLIVDPEGSPGQFGDEPLLIARKLGVPVVIGADRYQAGLLAESKFPQGKLHLLDDGFQHRRLHRDFDIVLIQPSDLHDSLLPFGRLRENLSALHRGDAFVTSPETNLPSRHRYLKPVWLARRNIQFLLPMSRVVAFCGIARREQFFSALRKLGMDLADTIRFSDHHHYDQEDIDFLLRAKAETGAKGFITTEKDAINLGHLISQLRTFEAAGLDLELENPAHAIQILLDTLGQRCGFHL